MSVIETMTFQLSATTHEAAFLQADRRVQTEFAYHQPGLLRRTTARGRDGNWIVVDVWRSAEEADACDERWGQDAVTREFVALVDEATTRTQRYTTLD